MPFFCFFCIKTLREACMIIAVLYALFAFYHVGWALYALTVYPSHWLYYLTLLVGIISIPFHGFLFLGARDERKEFVYPWIMFTMVVTFPFCLLYIIVCAFEALFLSLIEAVLVTILRVYMWTQVRQYHTELVTRRTEDPSVKPEDNQAPSSQYPAMAV